jgi:hypothetical protein
MNGPPTPEVLEAFGTNVPVVPAVHGADGSLLESWSTGQPWPQLLLRATVYRLAARQREGRGVMPIGSDGYVAREGRLLGLVEDRL